MAVEVVGSSRCCPAAAGHLSLSLCVQPSLLAVSTIVANPRGPLRGPSVRCPHWPLLVREPGRGPPRTGSRGQRPGVSQQKGGGGFRGGHGRVWPPPGPTGWGHEGGPSGFGPQGGTATPHPGGRCLVSRQAAGPPPPPLGRCVVGVGEGRVGRPAAGRWAWEKTAGGHGGNRICWPAVGAPATTGSPPRGGGRPGVGLYFTLPNLWCGGFLRPITP